MRPDWLRTADERILRYFEVNPPDYVPLMANRLNVHLDYADLHRHRPGPAGAGGGRGGRRDRGGL